MVTDTEFEMTQIQNTESECRSWFQNYESNQQVGTLNPSIVGKPKTNTLRKLQKPSSRVFPFKFP